MGADQACAVLPEPIVRDQQYYAAPPDAYAAQRCRLDFYRPACSGYPSFVYLHGGGLTEGNVQEGLSFALRMTHEGIGVAIVSYRLAPRAKSPQYIEDAAAATAWVMQHVAEFGGDARKVIVTGHSAGGYLAAMVGLDGRQLAKFGRSNLELAGCMPTSGQMLTHFAIRDEMGLPRTNWLADHLSPLYHAGAKAPPLFCIAGSNDMPARVEENALLVAARRAAGFTDVDFLVAPGRDHGTIRDRLHEPDDVVALAMLDFVKRVS